MVRVSVKKFALPAALTIVTTIICIILLVFLKNSDIKVNQIRKVLTTAEDDRTIQYIVAQQPISAGTEIAPELLGYYNDPNADPPINTLTDNKHAIGKLAKVDILPGQFIVPDALIDISEWRMEAVPIVANEMIYFYSSDGHLYAVDNQTQQQIWRFDTESLLYSPFVVDDGIAYVLSGRGQHKRLQALDATTGQEVWQFAIRNQILSSPTVFNGVVYLRDNAGNMYGLDARDGREIWRSKVSP